MIRKLLLCSIFMTAIGCQRSPEIGSTQAPPGAWDTRLTLEQCASRSLRIEFPPADAGADAEADGTGRKGTLHFDVLRILARYSSFVVRVHEAPMQQIALSVSVIDQCRESSCPQYQEWTELLRDLFAVPDLKLSCIALNASAESGDGTSEGASGAEGQQEQKQDQPKAGGVGVGN